MTMRVFSRSDFDPVSPHENIVLMHSVATSCFRPVVQMRPRHSCTTLRGQIQGSRLEGMLTFGLQIGHLGMHHVTVYVNDQHVRRLAFLSSWNFEP